MNFISRIAGAILGLIPKPLMGPLSIIGIPLGIASALLLRLCGIDIAKEEGFAGVGAFLGWCVYWGIVTLILVSGGAWWWIAANVAAARALN